METTISRSRYSADQIRESAFRDLEQSLCTIKEVVSHMGDDPIALRMKGAIFVAENSLKIIDMTPGGEIKALSGPRYGDDMEHDFDAGDDTDEPIHVEATTVERKDEPAVTSNGNGHHVHANGNGQAETQESTKEPRSYAIAHAKVKHRCGAHELGCTKERISGNSHGRHQQLCAFFQTARLLEAGYQIDTVEDYIRAIKKEYKKLPYSSADRMVKEINQKHGSYRKVLLAVKRGLRERAKKGAASKKK